MIDFYRKNGDLREHLHLYQSTAPAMRMGSSSRLISSYFFVEVSFLATMTTSCPGGSLSLFNLKNSLKRRLMRFLFTASPTFLLTVTPSLGMPDSLGCKKTMKFAEESRFPLS